MVWWLGRNWCRLRNKHEQLIALSSDVQWMPNKFVRWMCELTELNIHTECCQHLVSGHLAVIRM